MHRVGDVANPPGAIVREALFPNLGPLLTDVVDVGWSEIESRHQRGVGIEHVRPQRPSGVHPVEINVVVGRAHHQRLQVRRVFDANLPLNHAPVGVPPHADAAIAPGLGGDPFDHVVGVVLLLFGVDVLARTSGVAGAADVVVDDRIAAFGEVARSVRGVAILLFLVGGLDTAQSAVRSVVHDGGELAWRIGAHNDRADLHTIPHDRPHGAFDFDFVLGLGDSSQCRRCP